jgi:hypothetical protein
MNKEFVMLNLVQHLKNIKPLKSLDPDPEIDSG